MKGPTEGITLDTGALLALEQAGKGLVLQNLIEKIQRGNGGVCVPASVVAQAWRGGKQVRLARLLKSPDIEIVPLTFRAARSIGVMCAESDHHDVVDVHVALCARERRHAVVTSDPGDIARIDPALSLFPV